MSKLNKGFVLAAALVAGLAAAPALYAHEDTPGQQQDMMMGEGEMMGMMEMMSQMSEMMQACTKMMQAMTHESRDQMMEQPSERE